MQRGQIQMVGVDKGVNHDLEPMLLSDATVMRLHRQVNAHTSYPLRISPQNTDMKTDENRIFNQIWKTIYSEQAENRKKGWELTLGFFVDWASQVGRRTR